MTPDEIKRLIAEATPGPWCVADETVVWTQINDPVETTYDIGYPVAEAGRWKSRLGGKMWPEGQPEANARLIAAAPDLAAQVVRLTEALEFYADPEIYKPHPHGPGFDRRDLSYVARAALEALK